jgi:transcriptional antiterminator Rof (Rho-off)
MVCPPPDNPHPDARLRELVDKAFDYRGDVTVTLSDGRKVDGYLFDRRQRGSDSCIRLIVAGQDEKLAIRYDQIADIALTGRDPAEGKSWQTWVKKYHEKKAKGESASLEPEPLE